MVPKRLSLALAALALSSPDLAAKQPVALKARAQAQLTTVDWSGYYVGISGGLVRGGAAEQTPSGNFLNPIAYPFSTSQFPSSMGDQNSYGGGGQIGYWRQTDRLVWGYEADYFTGANAHSQNRVQLVAPLSGAFISDFNYQINWMTTLRARAGLAFEHFLLYATGGLAVASIKSGPMSSFTVGANVYDGTHSATRTGWVVGAGLEYAINERWSIKQEYLYADLGNEGFSYGDSTNNPLSTGFTFTANVHHRVQLYRFGLNFKF